MPVVRTYSEKETSLDVFTKMDGTIVQDAYPHVDQDRCAQGLRATQYAGVEVCIIYSNMSVETVGGYHLPIWTHSNTLTVILVFGRTDSETNDGIIRDPHDGIVLCASQEYLPLQFQNTIPIRRVRCAHIDHTDGVGGVTI